MTTRRYYMAMIAIIVSGLAIGLGSGYCILNGLPEFLKPMPRPAVNVYGVELPTPHHPKDWAEIAQDCRKQSADFGEDERSCLGRFAQEGYPWTMEP